MKNVNLVAILGVFFAIKLCTPIPVVGQDYFDDGRVLVDDFQGAIAVEVSDLDGDGRPDIVAAAELDDQIIWIRNMGDGNFDHAVIIANSINAPYSVWIGDLNGDGWNDVLSAGRYDNQVQWYQNLGGGLFGGKQIISTQVNGTRAVVAADLDDDGDLDVLSASEYDGKLAWYPNLGTGVFGAQSTLINGSGGLFGLMVADVDSDGIKDILYTNANFGSTSWIRGLGGGAFASPIFIGVGDIGNRVVRFGDLNGDGNSDVIVPGTDVNRITWYAGNGDGSFGPKNILDSYSGIDYPVHIELEDVDLDGDLDVLCANTDGYEILWFANNGSGVFTNGEMVDRNATKVHGIKVSDLDGDQLPDLVAAIYWNHSINWYKGLGDTCGQPSGLTAFFNPVSQDLHLQWTPVDGAEGYLIKGRNADGSDWRFQSSQTPEKILFIELKPGVAYEWRVRSYCPMMEGIWSVWSEKQAYSLPTEDWGKHFGVGSDLNAQINNFVFPNPFSQSLQITLPDQTDSVQLSIISVDGKLIRKMMLMSDITLDVDSRWPDGLYFIRMTWKDQVRVGLYQKL